jgi:hypothetical protein
MKLTALVTLLAAMTVGAVNAAETTTANTTSNKSSSSLKNFYNKVKESPFSQAYLNDTYAQYNIDGITSYHYLYNHYKLNAKNKVSIIPSFKTDMRSEYDNGEKVNHTRYNSTQLRYSYSGLLNQNDHGIGLSVQGRYYINGSTNAEATGSDGYGRLLLLGSRTFGKNTFSFNTDSVIYNKNSSSASNTHYNKIGAGYGYSFTDWLSASGSLNWYKFSANNTDAITEYSYYALSVDFSTPIGISITPYIEGTLTKAQDERDGLAEDFIRNSSVGLSLYYSWF